MHSLIILLSLNFPGKRYGTSVLEDNFVARIYTSYDSEGQFLGKPISINIYFVIIIIWRPSIYIHTLSFIAFYTVLNCYVYVLAYVYSPTSTQLKSNRLMKDNPTFSMVNESDEEDDEIEDDSETGAMLRPTSQRAGFYRILIVFIWRYTTPHNAQIHGKYNYNYNLCHFRRRINKNVWRS